MMLNRRAVLKYGFFGAGMLTIGGIGLGIQQSKIVEPNQPLQVLSIQEFSILYAIANRLLPASDRFPAASELQVAETVDGILATADDFTQAELKQVLVLIENALVSSIFEGHTRPFTQSSSVVQDRLLQSWQRSSLHLRRTAFKALNGLCGAAFYSNPQTHDLVGYDGPPSHLMTLVKQARIDQGRK